MNKPTLFIKSHIDTYTKKNGAVVTAHDDNRQKKKDAGGEEKEHEGDDEPSEEHKTLAMERAEKSTRRAFPQSTSTREAMEHYRQAYHGHMQMLTGKKPK